MKLYAQEMIWKEYEIDIDDNKYQDLLNNLDKNDFEAAIEDIVYYQHPEIDELAVVVDENGEVLIEN